MSARRKVAKQSTVRNVRRARSVKHEQAMHPTVKAVASVGTIAAMLATVVSGMSYAAGDSFVGAGSSLHLAWVPFLSQQFSDVELTDTTDVDAVINAGTENQTDLLQNGGSGLTGFSFQNADVGSNADTAVDAPINAGALNAAEVLQLGGSSQTAFLGADAATDVDALINAGSLNDTEIVQSSTDGAVQDATVGNEASTDVDSTINAGSMNSVGVFQGNIPYVGGASWTLVTDDTVGGSTDNSYGSPCTSNCSPAPCTSGCGSSSSSYSSSYSSSSSSVPGPCSYGQECPPSPCSGGCGGGVGGTGIQVSGVDLVAETDVDSTNNSLASNITTILQNSDMYLPCLLEGSQYADVTNIADAGIDSVINAGALNDVEVLQVGGGWNTTQIADVSADADTDVDSTNNSVAMNLTEIVQNAGGFGFQFADVFNDADSDIDSTINAGSLNSVGLLQVAGDVDSTAQQSAEVNVEADTDVDSTNNSVATNGTIISQSSEGSLLAGCPLYGCGLIGIGGTQYANVGNEADSSVDSLINAASVNDVELVQASGDVDHGTQSQYAILNAGAATVVDSENNSVAVNETGIFQDALLGGLQDASVGNEADSSVDSTINAGSLNNLEVVQVGGDVDHGASAQYADVNAPALTVVSSENNSVAANETGIFQDALLGGWQGASVGNSADSDVDSTINAVAENNIGVDQVGGDVDHGAAAQYVAVNAPVITVVLSENNAGASNETAIVQEGGAGLGGNGGGCGIGGSQSAGVCNEADSNVDSTINAGSQNNIEVNQVGGDVNHGAAAQYIEVNAPATTVVLSENNSGASNSTAIEQDGSGFGGLQDASVGNSADSDIDSTINAGSQNNIEVNQLGGNVDHGAQAQYVEINAPSTTVVNSENNSVASNETGISQQQDAPVLTYGASCQSGGCSLTAPGVQSADAGNEADSNVDSTINANSVNNIAVTQDGGDSANQSATVCSPSSTTVNSEINAGSGNTTGIVQEGGGFMFSFPF
ncbi:MAG: hypothetical protein WC698_02320 [Candidatus Peribacteraceae bacterium]